MKKRNLLRNVAMFLLALAPITIESFSSVLWIGEENLPDTIEY